jgi:hypothetical protein
MDRAAVRTPAGVAAVFLDLEGDHRNLHLLDDANVVTGGSQAVPAVGANLQDVVVRGRSKQLGWHQRAFVLGMSGLSANVALILSRRWRGFGWLNDVRGGRFGGG